MPRDSTLRACLTFREPQLRALQALSRETGAPVAELTRRAVDAYVVGRVAGYVPGPLRPGPDDREAGPTSSKTD